MLHSSGFAGSSFLTPSQTSTFRRPATSHQRSEHLRIQSLQQDLAATNHLLETSSEQDHGWQPFFESRATVFSRDTTSKGGAGSQLSSGAASIRCVIKSGAVPTLVIAPLVQRPTVEELQSSNTIKNSPNPPFKSSPIFPTNAQSEPRPDQERKSRTSFPLSGIFPSPSSSGKRGMAGSLKLAKGSRKSQMERRVVSAPLQGGSRLGSKSSVEDLVEDRNKQHETTPKNLSSPLTPSGRSPAINTNSTADAPNSPNSPRPDHPSSPFNPTSPFSSSPPNIPSLVSSRVRSYPHRESRVPSDRDSTIFSSDNEHSRVFSTDGEDTDGRSETLYDSIRTGGTGSSHSGVRGQRIENLFGETDPQELVQHNLSALQEQLSGVIRSRPRELESFIAEEEESVRTPVRPVHSSEDRSPGSSQNGPDKILLEPRSPQPHVLHTPVPQEILVDDAFDGRAFDDDWPLDDQVVEGDSWASGAYNNTGTQRRFMLASRIEDTESQETPPSTKTSERPKSNIFEWSERQPAEKDSGNGSSPRPRTAHAQQLLERGGRSSARRNVTANHLRSQSVPLPPENPKQRFNNTSKLDAWMLGGKGVSEEWDNDFEFDEPSATTGPESAVENSKGQPSQSKGVVVPRSILERQATVHGQFGQVKELTLLVEELRRLRHSAHSYGILNGQASELWKEAEGIIDLASLEDDEPNYFSPSSPNSTSFDIESIEEESPSLHRRKRSNFTPPRPDPKHGRDTSQSVSHPSPAGSSKLTTTINRDRSDSVAKAKYVLENIRQHRSAQEPPPAASPAAPKKLPFDTTSLRDLVTRAGVVTRALKEVIRRIEDQDFVTNTPERQPVTPADPPFSQIFHQPSSPSSIKKSPRMPIRKRSGSFMGGSMTANDNELNAHVKIMTVV